MAKHTEIENRTEAMVLPIIEENGFELVDVEYVKEGANWYLRVYADKEGGISIDDCVLISRALEEKLDEEDFIEDAYILEVSSPGLGRPLKKEKIIFAVLENPLISNCIRLWTNKRIYRNFKRLFQRSHHSGN